MLPYGISLWSTKQVLYLQELLQNICSHHENVLIIIKGILRPIFCIDTNTHIDTKWKVMQNLLKKLFFQNVWVFINPFYRYHQSIISPTPIACDVMRVQHVIH